MIKINSKVNKPTKSRWYQRAVHRIAAWMLMGNGMTLEFRYVWKAPIKTMRERPITLIPYIQFDRWADQGSLKINTLCISFFIWVFVFDKNYR